MNRFLIKSKRMQVELRAFFISNFHYMMGDGLVSAANVSEGCGNYQPEYVR